MKVSAMLWAPAAAALLTCACAGKVRTVPLSEFVHATIAGFEKGAYEAGVGSADVRNAELLLEVETSTTTEGRLGVVLPSSPRFEARRVRRKEDSNRVVIKLKLDPKRFDKASRRVRGITGDIVEQGVEEPILELSEH